MRRRNDLSIYDRAAGEWWAGRRRWLRTLANMVPARLAIFDLTVGSWRGRRVLDLGCGGGFMSEAVARRGASVVGVDPLPALLEAARAHARSEDLPIGYRRGHGEEIPLSDGSVDTVVCVDVLEHVADLERTLREIARVLEPGGLFLFDTVNRTRLATVVMIRVAEDLLRIIPTGTHDPSKFIRPADLARSLEGLDFSVGPFVGMGPVGLDGRFDIRFGRLPTTLVQYAGHAVKRA